MSTARSDTDLLALVTAAAPADGTLSLRPLREDDLERIVEVVQDPEIPRWTLVPSPYGVVDAWAFLTESRRAARAGERLATVVCDADDRVIGSVGLVDLDRARAWAEVGYWIAAEARGRGVAVRAIELLRGFATASLGVTTLAAFVDPANAASRRVLEKAGFTTDGALVACERCGDVEPQRLRYRWSSSA